MYSEEPKKKIAEYIGFLNVFPWLLVCMETLHFSYISPEREPGKADKIS